ncbi:MAG: 4-hydroxythreonine-4-phosphate dehydrogenase PdxA [Pseudomonadota bacterium]
MAERRDSLPLAITMGEPGGVGGEILIKAWRALHASGPAFFAIDSPARLTSLGAAVAEITHPADAHARFGDALPILPLECAVDAEIGVADAKNAPAVIESIERAVAFALDGAAAGVVTNPIQKASLAADGFRFPGHTEYLAALTDDAPMPDARERGAVMMIAGPSLRTVPITIHHAVKDAIALLTPDLIFKAGLITAQALRTDFGVAEPRLAFTGLNPHAGEDSLLGAEDGLVIAPAIDWLREAGVDAKGPLPADAMFHEAARASYDAALAMLHDQALIPAKTLGFHDAVNVTLGLPIVRTSPDHGTALDIAGKGLANADSLIAAIRMAADMAARRRLAV